MGFCFGDIVVVDRKNIGVVLRCWDDGTCDVFVRMYNLILNYPEEKMRRYMVRHKYLDEAELAYQQNAAGVPDLLYSMGGDNE